MSESPKPPSPKWVIIADIRDTLEADIIKGLLEAEGIELAFSEEGYLRTFGFASNPTFFSQLLVPESQEKEARQIIQDFRNGNLEQGGFPEGFENWTEEDWENYEG